MSNAATRRVRVRRIEEQNKKIDALQRDNIGLRVELHTVTAERDALRWQLARAAATQRGDTP